MIHRHQAWMHDRPTSSGRSHGTAYSAIPASDRRRAWAVLAATLLLAPLGANAQEQQNGVTVLRGAPSRQSATDPGSASAPNRPAFRTPPLPGGPSAIPTPSRIPVAGSEMASLPRLTLDSLLAEGKKLSDNDAAAFKAALQAADENRWQAARALAPSQTAPVLAKFIDWLNYRSAKGDGSFAQIQAFLAANPDWPEETVLRRQAEDRIGHDVPAADIVAFFRQQPPQTSAGIMKRLMATEKVAPENLAAVVRESWRNGTFRNNDELEFLNRYRKHLGDGDHIARFERLLRSGRDQAARELLPLLPANYKPVAETRLALAGKSPDAPTLLRGLPAPQQRDAELALEQTRFYIRTNDRAEATRLLRDFGTVAGGSEDWWRLRHQLARSALKERRYRDAYELAAGHGLSRGPGFADGEFLAGWIALRFLSKSDLAIEHFRKLDAGVGAPVSKSRAAYWLGRAHEAENKTTEALAWYDRAAQHGQTYYGQLAAKKLPGGFARMPSDPASTDADRQSVGRHDAIDVVRYLDQVGEAERARPFLTRLSRLVKTAGEIGLTARLAVELGLPEIAVSIARRAVDTGVVLFQTAFPVVDLGETGPLERSLVLALTRQESNFQTNARSPANALGLMQLIPSTAQAMATRLGLPYSPDRLTADPAYNVALGTRYLSEMLQKFGGSYEIALAAYNAGPGNADRWLKENGDPRGGRIDMVDWIELIDFQETRNYVQRVMEGVAVYRDRLSGSFETIPLRSAR